MKWSVNSTDESKEYSKIAVELIMAYWRQYIFENDEKAAKQIMIAANYAGRAINIAQTTASTHQPITYTILYGNEIAVVNDNNTITILNEGKFTLRAIQEGNDSYLATETIEKELENIDEIIINLQKIFISLNNVLAFVEHM